MNQSNEVAFSVKEKEYRRVVFVDQLVEWSLPTPEVYGSNLVIGKI